MSKAKTFDAISDISQLSGRLRLLWNFSLSEWRLRGPWASFSSISDGPTMTARKEPVRIRTHRQGHAQAARPEDWKPRCSASPASDATLSRWRERFDSARDASIFNGLALPIPHSPMLVQYADVDRYRLVPRHYLSVLSNSRQSCPSRITPPGS